MDEIVPGVLQRVRESDILSRAGVAVAAQGREYARTGTIHTPNRQGARLSGIVEVADTPAATGVTDASDGASFEQAPPAPFASRRFPVTVEVRENARWSATCTCTPVASPENSGRLCAHAAALLYYWLSHPIAFAASESPIPPTPASRAAMPAIPPMPALQGMAGSAPGAKRVAPTSQARPPLASSASTSTADSLAQLALSDLRNLAKEYELATNGVGKQELIEGILGALKQAEVVRKMVATLEKTQRQFLATFTLAGGYMSEEELRSLYERFGLGGVEQLQQALASLSAKGLAMRTGINSSMQPRSGVPGSPAMLDVNWYVPPEVRAALHIALPITPFDSAQQSVPPQVAYAEPYRLLADLLLVARALEGQVIDRESRKVDGPGRGSSGSLLRSTGLGAGEGSVSVPPPVGLPPAGLLSALQDALPYSMAFLRFAYRILRLGEILYMEGETQHSLRVTLHMLPNAAELLLGPTRAEVIAELCTHWLQQSTSIELFELTEESLRLRCRATPMNQPALRAGELEAENSEARQRLISLLAQAPTHQWISFPAFARFVYRLHPTFLQRRQRLFPIPHWWIEQEDGRQLHPTQWNDWQRAEGHYLARIIQGPLHWWGACDIALSPDGQLQAFRLTSMASLLFHSSKDAAPATAPAAEPVEISAFDMSGIELSARAEILMVASAGNWPLIALVERFARIKGVQDGRLRYEITPLSLSEALRRGEDLAPFLDLLRCSVEGERQNEAVESMLRQLEQRLANYGRVRLYTGVTLLEVADTLTLRELAATTSIDRQVISSIYPTLMILKKQGGEQLVDELRRRGQAPLFHEGE